MEIADWGSGSPTGRRGEENHAIAATTVASSLPTHPVFCLWTPLSSCFRGGWLVGGVGSALPAWKACSSTAAGQRSTLQAGCLPNPEGEGSGLGLPYMPPARTEWALPPASRAEHISTVLALNTTRYLTLERDYLPWEAALSNLGYLKTMFDRSEVYGPMKVSLSRTPRTGE